MISACIYLHIYIVTRSVKQGHGLNLVSLWQRLEEARIQAERNVYDNGVSIHLVLTDSQQCGGVVQGGYRRLGATEGLHGPRIQSECTTGHTGHQSIVPL